MELELGAGKDIFGAMALDGVFDWFLVLDTTGK